MAVMSCSAQKSTSRPLKKSTFTLSNFAVTSRNISSRSSIVNRPCFVSLTSTATVTASNRFEARSTMSMCPLVTGSKDPGHTTLVMAVTVPKGRFAVFLLLDPLDTAGPFKVVALGAFDHNERVRSRPRRFTQCREDLVQFVRREGIGRVDKENVVRRARRPLQEAGNVGHGNMCAADPEVRDVLLDNVSGRAVLFDEVGRRRTPGQCLDSDGAGAGKQIEEAQAIERSVVRLQCREQCFTDAVGRRPSAVSRRHVDPTATELTGNDASHVFSRYSASSEDSTIRTASASTG